MAQLSLHRSLPFKVGIPLWILINGHPIGIMRGSEARITLPESNYTLGVKIIFPVGKRKFEIGSEESVTISEETPLTIRIEDRERIWNILFDIDLVAYIVFIFLTLNEPWNTIYHVISEGFFAIWLLRIYLIRKQYFKFSKL